MFCACGDTVGKYNRLSERVCMDFFSDERTLIFGNALFIPAHGIATLLASRMRFDRMVEIGTLVDIEAVEKTEMKIREHLGYIYTHLLSDRYVGDTYSKEHYLHFGAAISDDNICMPAVLCEDAELLNSVYNLGCQLKPDNSLPLTDLGYIIAACALKKLFVIEVNTAAFRTDFATHTPLYRFIRTLGLDIKNLDGTVEINTAATKVQEAFEALKEQTRKKLEVIAGSSKQTTTGQDVMDLLGPEEKEEPQSTVSRGPRRLRLGDIFDPTTHYDKDYYGDGNGLLYTRPDGTDGLYKGPAYTWDGFNRIVSYIQRALTAINKQNKTYLSLGCGAGSDVNAFIQEGWASIGIDLSEIAVKVGRKQFGFKAKNLILGDFTDKNALPFEIGKRKFHLVASYDFLEHIWQDEIYDIVVKMLSFVAVGGYTFHDVCTRFENEQDFVVEKGVRFTAENSGMLCSGHVNVRDWYYWYDLFNKAAKKLDIEIEFAWKKYGHFNMLMASDPALSNVKSWSPKNILFFRRVK